MTGHATPEEQGLIEQARAAVHDQPGDADAWVRLGRLLLEPAHEVEQAIETFEAGLQADASGVETRFWLAAAHHLHTFDFPLAERLLEGALALDPDRPEFWSLLASVRRERGASPGDIRSLAERAVDLAPDWPLPRRQLIDALLDLDKSEAAAAHLAVLDRLDVIAEPKDLLEADFEQWITGRRSRPDPGWRSFTEHRLRTARMSNRR